MATKVYVIPGIMGSELWHAQGSVKEKKVWLSYANMALDGVEYLKLAPNGTAPDNVRKPCRPKDGGLINEYYGDLVQRLKSRYTVVPYSYDWRKDLQPQSLALAEEIATAAPGEVAIVGHSMGGLVGRGALKYLAGQGKADRVSRLVTLGTPNWGSYSITRLFGGIDKTYRLFLNVLLAEEILSPYFLGGKGKLLDDAAVSWPGAYQLLPAKNHGPLAGDAAQTAAIYSTEPYKPRNGGVSADHLARAVAYQDWLADAIYPTKQVTIQGYSFPTASNLKSPYRPWDGHGYDFTIQGDGTVTNDQGSLAGVNSLYVKAGHGEMPYSPVVLANVIAMIDNGLNANTILN